MSVIVDTSQLEQVVRLAENIQQIITRKNDNQI